MKYTLLGTVVPEMVRTEKKPEVGRVREAGGTAVSQQELRAGCLTFYSKDERDVKRCESEPLRSYLEETVCSQCRVTCGRILDETERHHSTVQRPIISAL